MLVILNKTNLYQLLVLDGNAVSNSTYLTDITIALSVTIPSTVDVLFYAWCL